MSQFPFICLNNETQREKVDVAENTKTKKKKNRQRTLKVSFFFYVLIGVSKLFKLNNAVYLPVACLPVAEKKTHLPGPT